MISIIDYKMGNISSLLNAFDYLGIKADVISAPSEIKYAKKLMLPGVGSFGQAMNNIKSMEILEVIKEAALVKKIPVLGICLGMQLLTRSSDEDGFSEGLGFIDAKIDKFTPSNEFPVPHVGFNSVKFNPSNSTLFQGLSDECDFYFVHSYRLKTNNNSFVAGTTNYGEDFCCAIEQDNIFGVQFHPEKSQNNGLMVLKNFSEK